MKILHVVEDYTLESGGLRTVIKDLNTSLNAAGVGSFVIASKKEVEDNIFTVATEKPWLYTKEWQKEFKELHTLHQFNVVHIHGVWMYPQYKAAQFCIQNNIPFILSCHGMYEPWLWKKGTFKKKIYFKLVVKNVFKKAKFIHAITPQEAVNLSALFTKSKIIEIPNLINLPKTSIASKVKESSYILYLGRLDQKKGIDLLIHAFSKVHTNSVQLLIAGATNDYKCKLDELVEKLGLSSKVRFLGMVTGAKKQSLISNALVLVAPSYSEVIGMVNLEAAILKTPVITTYQTGLNKEWNANGGQLINPNINELIVALEHVLSWSVQEREENGQKLYQFVRSNYSWTGKFKDWLALYESCII